MQRALVKQLACMGPWERPRVVCTHWYGSLPYRSFPP